MFVSHKKIKQQKPADDQQRLQNQEEDESSDEGFETVKTDKKRIKNKPAFPVKQDFAPLNPHFPATDPNKIVVLEKKPKGAKTERGEAEPEKKEPVQSELTKNDDLIVRNKPAAKQEAPVKSETKAAVKAEVPVRAEAK